MIRIAMAAMVISMTSATAVAQGAYEGQIDGEFHGWEEKPSINSWMDISFSKLITITTITTPIHRKSLSLVRSPGATRCKYKATTTSRYASAY